MLLSEQMLEKETKWILNYCWLVSPAALLGDQGLIHPADCATAWSQDKVDSAGKDGECDQDHQQVMC